ncbi:hypothetical protein B9Z19DRAFT_1134335 [Tuber borchii]|uniref:Myb/SANT-like domain-containing protein n=1 Tax=Tuber borchii TaxID=42251 RepID=A0A2T6ZEC5_TUBBO|nr:hypothetical protein B9Z19DRAFT_1134335 [Tuber borchii]
MPSRKRKTGSSFSVSSNEDPPILLPAKSRNKRISTAQSKKPRSGMRQKIPEINAKESSHSSMPGKVPEEEKKKSSTKVLNTAKEESGRQPTYESLTHPFAVQDTPNYRAVSQQIIVARKPPMKQSGMEVGDISKEEKAEEMNEKNEWNTLEELDKGQAQGDDKRQELKLGVEIEELAELEGEAVQGLEGGFKMTGRYQWLEEATDTYCEALVDIIRAGGHSDSGFKTPVWVKVCASMQKKFGIQAGTLTPKHCKDKYDNSCNETTGELLTSDEVWKSEIAVNPKAKKLRGKPLPNCWELNEIFSGSIATGKNALQGRNLKAQFSGEWKAQEPLACKTPVKSAEIQSTSLMLNAAINEFRTSQTTTGLTIRLAVCRVMGAYRIKEGWSREQIHNALDLFKDGAMADIFNKLEDDPDYEEHWLRYQIA